jgi:type IV pilus assembly protein PilB
VARKKLGEILIQAGVLDEERLRTALAEQQRWGGPLGKILVEMRFCSEEALVQALAHQLNFPAVRLDDRLPDKKALALVPVERCEEHTLFPLAVDGKFLEVAMADPTNLAVIDELRIKTRLNVRAYLAGPQDIGRAIARHYHGRDFGMDVGGRMITPPVSEPELEPAFGGGGARPLRDRFAFDGPSPGTDPLAMTAPISEVVGAAPARAPGASLVDMTQLSERVQALEALLARDEDVLRKLMGLLIQKGICTREEILKQLR